MPGNIKLVEKIGYAMGDTAANIAWRTLTTFLFVFYTDVFGISAAAVGSLLLIVRITDGISDLGMGIIADRTHTKQGKFRPWILWTTIPLGLLLVLTFTTPNFGMTGKLIYAYTTYILLMLVYTANNVPYSALMGVISDDVRVRNDLSSFRFAGAYLGGIIAQGLLIYLVMWLGNGDNVINEEDEVMIGRYNPKFNMGIYFNLSYKNISLLILGNANFGYDIVYGNDYYWVDGNKKYSEVILGRWTPERAAVASYPRLSSLTSLNNNRTSDYWMQNADCFSLDRVQLNYTLPSHWFGKNTPKNFTVYLRGYNLLFLAKDARKRQLNIGSAPQMRSILLGCNVAF